MLTRKMIRDLRENQSQFLSIFLLMFLGMMLYSGMNAISYGMKQSSKTYYQECNLADAFVYGNEFTKEQIEAIKENKDIQGVEGRTQCQVSLVGSTDTTLQLNRIATNEISKLYLVSGEGYNKNKEGIWLDQSFAEANGITVGDIFSYSFGGLIEEKKVLGLVYHPEYVFALKDETEALPNHKTYGFFFVSEKYTKFGKEGVYSSLLIDSSLSKEELTKKLGDALLVNQLLVTMQKDITSVNMFDNEIKQMEAMEIVFPIIFLLVAVLTILTTMTRITINQRQQIGILKALGFSNKKILVHYMSFGLLISLVGSLLGMILGILCLPKLVFSFQRTMYILPEWKQAAGDGSFIVMVIAICSCCLCGVFAAKKELHGVAAQIIRPKEIKVGKHNAFEKLPFWKKASFDLQWNVRDCLRNKLRVFITVFGVVGGMALILCGLGMKDTMAHLVEEGYRKLSTYQTKVTKDSLNTDNPPTIERGQWIMELGAEVRKGEKTMATAVTVIGTGDYLYFRSLDGRILEAPKDACFITSKLADKLGVKEGDEISFKPYGLKSYVTCTIHEIVRNPIGQGVFLGESYYKSLGQTFSKTACLTDLEPSSIEVSSYKSVQSKQDLIKNVEELMTMVDVIIILMIVAASLLGIVVLYNLGILSFYERSREFATLKVLGFSYGRLQRLNRMQTIWLTVIGIIIGMPCGYLLLSYMIRFMGDSYDMVASIRVVSYGIAVACTLVLSLLVNSILGRKLKTIDMVSALKSIE